MDQMCHGFIASNVLGFTLLFAMIQGPLDDPKLKEKVAGFVSTRLEVITVSPSGGLIGWRGIYSQINIVF